MRFAARFDFQLDPATRAALTAMADQVRVVAPERIAQELRKILVHSRRATGMKLAFDTGLLAAVLPDLGPLRGCPQEARDEDVWEHTLRVLDFLSEPSFPLALAALLHDVGKPRNVAEHAAVGGQITDQIARDLRLSNAERERAVWLVAHHHDLRAAESLRRSRLKMILAEPGCAELIALDRAHAAAIGGPARHVEFCAFYLREQPDGPINPPPLVTGNDLAGLGLKPGPRFKTLLDEIREAQLEGEIHNRDEALAWLGRVLPS